MLGWERTKTQSGSLDGSGTDIVLKPAVCGKTMIEAARTPAHRYRVDAQQRDHAWRMHGRPRRVVLGFAVQRRPLRVLAPRLAILALRDGRDEYVRCGNALPLPSPWNDIASQFRICSCASRAVAEIVPGRVVDWDVRLGCPEKPDSHYERKISLVCCHRKVPPPASEPVTLASLAAPIIVAIVSRTTSELHVRPPMS